MNTETFRPLNDNVLVKRDPNDEVSKGGIIIPPRAQEKVQRGTVISVGPGKLNDDGERLVLDVEAGDKIVFSKYAGNEIKVVDEDRLVIREQEILGVDLTDTDS